MNADIRNKAFTQDQINKIGNTIIYFSNKIPDLNRTKILSLLFIIEEACIKKFGHHFFGIDFQLWKSGPIIKDIFIDLSYETPILLNEFIKQESEHSSNFIANKTFNNDEFSDNDIELMDLIINFASEKSASNLVDHTQSPHSLWRKSAIQYGVLESLETDLLNSTEYTIDFSLLFDNSSMPSYLKERFEESKENLEFVKHLKR
ncbi:hypothetical protein A4H97_29090 [Niastella yeongjuensis]|uniref:Antitoxin SocA-like Panacea domain-containing protein n=1 Tax=Niastella yeongjuensis TaxID=354355 RepID=A0A1V9ERZ9_9BACT|nr:Panacea domain-containing protein [Niastella yeongjuensis]OQP48943.1 hypothetical protein A4H97_29090 [Niastella yeongjuensis]SEP08523.1 Protein of unknown function [Niastella yeongjuensis]